MPNPRDSLARPGVRRLDAAWGPFAGLTATCIRFLSMPIVAGILAVLAVSALSLSPGARESGMTGTDERVTWTLPTLSFTTEDGTNRRIPSPDGVTVVVFWADWCKGCLGKLGEYDRLWKSTSGTGHQIVGINMDPDEQVFRDAARKYGVTFPGLHDPGGLVLERLLGGSLPRVLAVDPGGRILFSGEGSPDDFTALRRLLNH